MPETDEVANQTLQVIYDIGGIIFWFVVVVVFFACLYGLRLFHEKLKRV